jgi:hypothetical protein
MPCEDLKPGMSIDDGCPNCGHRIGSHSMPFNQCDICSVIDAVREMLGK